MKQKVTIVDLDDKKVERGTAFLEFAFRPLFLCAALFSVIALIIWVATLAGHFTFTPYGGSLWWHMHEMLLGFVSAVIAGFLLTAVQTWTGVRAVHGLPLVGLILLWLSGRLLLALPTGLPSWFIAAADLAFLPVVALVLGRAVIKVKQWRNIMFVPLLLLITFFNFNMHYGVSTENIQASQQSAFTIVMLITLLMTIMAGRVFPMFTANGTKTAKVNPLPWLEMSVLISTIILVLLSTGLFSISVEITALCYLCAAIFHTIRVLRWRIWVTLKTPLVWSLHLSYWPIPIAFILFAVAPFWGVISTSQALHSLTVGSMAMMVLSMMSRVSLGHTGRMIVASRTITLSFIALFIAFIVRVFAGLFITDYVQVLFISVLCWVIAFSLFIWRYLPILLAPRQ